MTNISIIQQIGLRVGFAALFLGITACGSIIEVVPNTPTPSSSKTNSPIPSPTTTAVSNLPARIVANSINLDAPVVEMGWRVVERWGEQISEWDMPHDGAAWHGNSARPGESSNIVISGHNESTGGQVFADLEELQVGDEITLWTDTQQAFVYQVTEKTIVRTFAISDEADTYLQSVMDPTPQEQLTLITCWPRWTNTHRLIVIAEPKL